MRAHPFKIGLLAALAGICAWSLEWRIGFPFLFPIVFIWPWGVAYPDAHCIYTLGFFAIVFTVCRVFLASPLGRRNVSTAPDGVQG